MAYKNHVKAPASLSYVDFDPKTELKDEEGVDTLVISLSGFTKEQLKVQVNNAGILKVSGEKPENADGNRKQRFIKETMVPEGCDVNGIRAKFANGELRVILPRKVVTPPPPAVEQKDQLEEPAPTPSTPQTPEDAPFAKAETVGPADQKTEQPSDVNGKMARVKDQMMTGLQGRRTKAAIGFGVATMAMIAFGVFVAYKYGASSPSMYME